MVVVPFACKNDYLDRYAEPDKGWTDRDESRWPVPYWYIDTGMAALNMLHAAVAEGFPSARLQWAILPPVLFGFVKLCPRFQDPYRHSIIVLDLDHRLD